MLIASALILALALVSGSMMARDEAKLTSPTEYFGFKPGTSRKLCAWSDIKSYLQLLDRQSARVVYQDIGSTVLGEREIMMVISSEDNIANLGYYQEIQKKLADPRGLSDAEVTRLKSEAKAIYFVNAGIHSTEIGGVHAVLNAIWTFASTEDKELKEVLDNVILLMLPSVNPDGHVMTVDWYRKYLDTKYEGTGTPYMYHYYTGHDDNRDWFMFNLPESRNVGKVLYHDWFPEVVYDIHQMGSFGARLFVPPFFDPPNPEIPTIIFREMMLLGGIATMDLSAQNMRGVSVYSTYDTWWHGGMRSGPYYHNMVGLLTETASCNIATPIEIPFEKLTSTTRGLADPKQFSQFFPEPWEGGLWNFEMVTAYPESVIYSFAKGIAKFKDEFVSNFVKMGQDAVKKGLTQSPYAFVIPEDPYDPGTVNWMLEVLNFQGVEIHRAKKAFIAGGKSYAPGTYVVLTAQPYRPNVMALLDVQKYPDRSEYPGGPAERPYDVAGWTLPLQMGVECVKVEKSFDAELELVQAFRKLPGRIEPGDASYGYAFRPEANQAATVRVKLMEAGFQLHWLVENGNVCGLDMPAGTTIVLARQGLEAKVKELVSKYAITFYPISINPEPKTAILGNPRVGIYEPWGSNYDAGWTRLIFDQFEIPYTFMRDADVKAGKLIEKFDAIILPDTTTNSIKNGLSANSVPAEYAGGLGDAGLANLKEFIASGGTVILFDSMFDFATTILGAPVKNALGSVSSNDFYCPGSILEGDLVDKTNPVVFGMDDKFNLYFNASPAFDVTGPGVKILSKYPDDRNALLSGWLRGDKLLLGKANLLEYTYGKGKAILIGFRPQHRGQPHGTYKLFFNSIFYATMK